MRRQQAFDIALVEAGQILNRQNAAPHVRLQEWPAHEERGDAGRLTGFVPTLLKPEHVARKINTSRARLNEF